MIHISGVEVLSEGVFAPTPKGIIRNAEALYVEWNGVVDEVWDTAIEGPLDSSLESIYPSHFAVTGFTNPRTMMGLDSEADAGKKKKETAAGRKKDAAGRGTYFEEVLVDDKGRSLPRVFVPTDVEVEGGEEVDESHGLRIPRAFRSFSANDESEAMSISSSSSVLEVDPLLCAVFRIVERYSALTAGFSSRDFLWNLIYPQTSEGRPCYNPAGKYCIRLYLCGKWRRVPISDSLPVDAEGKLLLASSSNLAELWPALLSKAIYTVLAGCG